MTIIWCMVPKIWSATDIIFCHSGPFFALLLLYGLRKSKFWKNEKNTRRYYHFIHVYHKWQLYDVWLLRYGVWQTKILVILEHFLTFYTLTTQKTKFWKNEKTTSRYHHFTYVYHKWQSYSVWSLRYGAWWTEFFVILDHFLHFYSPNNLKNQNFKKNRKNT